MSTPTERAIAARERKSLAAWEKRYPERALEREHAAAEEEAAEAEAAAEDAKPAKASKAKA